MNKVFLAAPALFIAYGIIRLLDGIDGEHGPGLAWTTGHLLFLIGFLLYAVTLVALRGLLTRARGLSLAAVIAGLVGVAAFVRVTVIDLIVGFRAVDHADKSRVGDEYDRWPGNLGVYDVLYTAGPLLFLAGLLTLAILLTRARLLPVWSPILLVAGFVLISANLDLMPLGGLALLLAMVPLARTSPSNRRSHARAVSDRHPAA
ncbi:hypothetical protein GCM10009789_18660 [Kribbella sancticallisti]|uniref:Uncharacterized protein n=1 Tax=Kribbella sancticallisti TaxID=460087 RepID=A0ABN2CVZ2_9ACTN